MNKETSELVTRARLFATAAHAAVGQRRKYTDESYIVHPAEVVGIVASVEHTEEMLAAAWLHDVLEDTQVTYAVLYAEFGETVANLVHWLTDVSRPTDGNRRARKALDREHLSRAPAAAQTIKVADMISNSVSIVRSDPGFGRVYLEEMKALLEVLSQADLGLVKRASGMTAPPEGEVMYIPV
jgi:(p)ppGpp synthase/HD superfamily hydrolase